MKKIVSKTKYSRKEHKKFYIFHLFHKSTTMYWFMFLGVMLLILAVYNVLNKKNVMVTIMMFAITAAVLPFLIISKINEVVRKETPERKESTDTVEATKHKVTRSTDKTTGKAVIGWNEIEMICETNDYIYLYNQKNAGMFIKKADIIQGTVEEFRELALDRLPRNKRGKIPYKRYGKIKKEFKKEIKLKRKERKLSLKDKKK